METFDQSVLGSLSRFSVRPSRSGCEELGPERSRSLEGLPFRLSYQLTTLVGEVINAALGGTVRLRSGVGVRRNVGTKLSLDRPLWRANSALN